MEPLTQIQSDFISLFSKTTLKEHFFFTGGTALSALYLHHRISEDLDFFTEEEGQIPMALPILQEIAGRLKASFDIRRSFRTYMEIFFARKEEILRCDFAMDAPYRLQKKVLNDELDIYIDNVLDISCNKLSALFDRADPKDFVDIYYIDNEIIPFEELVEKAKKKHIGMDNYWLAISLAKVEDIAVLPKMLKQITIDELKYFFSEKAKWLMER